MCSRPRAPASAGGEPAAPPAPPGRARSRARAQAASVWEQHRDRNRRDTQQSVARGLQTRSQGSTWAACIRDPRAVGTQGPGGPGWAPACCAVCPSCKPSRCGQWGVRGAHRAPAAGRVQVCSHRIGNGLAASPRLWKTPEFCSTSPGDCSTQIRVPVRSREAATGP